jgi:hypothetical protein
MKWKFLERFILIAFLVVIFGNGQASRSTLVEKVSTKQTKAKKPLTKPHIHFSPIDFVKW